ncbi:MAG: hypothetical protein IPK60_10895 [Sandaracinaceae bacterium]|nr:hypothetical protein [Sandaracinaceae bacterium]
MTDTLIVETPFSELAELVDGLAPRVEGSCITLWTGIDVAEGSSVRFSVRLADGSPVFEGGGTCVARMDQGDDAYPPERFEITLDRLELDARNDVVFERLSLAAEGGGRGTGEVDIADIEDAPPSDYPPPLASDAPSISIPVLATSEHTTEMQLDDMVEDLSDDSIPPPSMRQAPPAAARRTVQRTGVLGRPSMEASWQPEAVARGESLMGSGKFAYGDNGLPRPNAPPRPDGQQVRVEPAPRPS